MSRINNNILLLDDILLINSTNLTKIIINSINFKKQDLNIDFLSIIKYYNMNEHKRNGVDEEEYILT